MPLPPSFPSFPPLPPRLPLLALGAEKVLVLSMRVAPLLMNFLANFADDNKVVVVTVPVEEKDSSIEVAFARINGVVRSFILSSHPVSLSTLGRVRIMALCIDLHKAMASKVRASARAST